MAAITFRAETKAMFLAPVEGRDPTSTTTLQEGLRITRPDDTTSSPVTGTGNRVATIKSLKIAPTSTINDVYGLYVEAPINKGASGNTVGASYSAYIGALTTTPTADHNYVFGLYVQNPTQGANQQTSILSEGDIQIGMTRNTQTGTLSIGNGPAKLLSGYRTFTIDWASDYGTANNIPTPTLVLNLGSVNPATAGSSKTINLGTGSLSGTTTVNIGSTTGGTVNVFGSLTLNSSRGPGMLSPTYGGTGVNNASRTITLAANGTIAGTSGLAATLVAGSNVVTLSTGSTSTLFVGQSIGSATGTGGFGSLAKITAISAVDTFYTDVVHASSGLVTFSVSPYTAASNTLVLEASSTGSTMRLPNGSINDIVLTDLSSATIKNKTIKIGNGGDNTFQISYDGTATNLTTVTGVTDGGGILATKNYVDAVKTGLDVKNSVRAATLTSAGALSSIATYSSASNTITSNSMAAISSAAAYFDGISLLANDRVLVKDYAASGAANNANGIYTVSQVGSGSSAWVLTRANDFCSATFTIPNLAAGSYTFTVSVTTGTIVPGQIITTQTTNYFPVGTIVTNVAGSSVTVSAASTNGSTLNNVVAYSTNVTAGAYTFCEEGNNGFGKNADTGFVLTTNQNTTQGQLNTGLIYVNNVDAIAFTTFSAAAAYSANNGIQLSAGNVFSIVANSKTVGFLDTPTASNLFQSFNTSASGGTQAGTAQYTNYLTGVGTPSGTFPDSTISAKLVYNNSPVINSGIDSGSSTFDAFSNTAVTQLNIGTGSGIATGTLNLGTGASSTGNKAINIGTGGTSVHTTAITIGTSDATAVANGTIALNAATISNAAATVGLFNSTVTSFSALGAAGLTTFNLASGATGTLNVNIASGATSASNTKTINIGTGGAASSTTNVNIGSTNGGTIKLDGGTVATNNSSLTFMSGLQTFTGLGGTALTTVDIGVGAPTATQTITLFAASTGVTQNIYLGSSPTLSGNTKTINIGTNSATSSTTNVNIGSTAGGTIKLDGGTVSTGNTSLALFNTNTTSIDFAGAATTLSMGAGSGSTINLNAATISSNQTSVSLLTTSSGTVSIGSTSGVTKVQGTQRNASPILLGTQSHSITNNPTITQGAYRRAAQYLLYGTLTTPATTATAVRLTADGSAASSANVPVIPTGSTWHVKAFIAVYAKNASQQGGASWEISATFRNNAGGTLAMVGDPVVSAAADTSATGMDLTNLILTIQEDTTNNSPQISISGGLAAGTYYCSALMQTLEVG